jgi:fluoride exporter
MLTLWIGLGGALGSIARYHLGRVVHLRAGSGFPWGTLAVNLLGSLLLAALMAAALRGGRVPDGVRLALAAGLLGGFTTYSSFNYEVMAMAQAGDWGRAAAYVAATLVGGLAAGAAGWLLARALVG